MLLGASHGHEMLITACGADKLDWATASFEGRATGKSHVSRVPTRPGLAEAAEGEGRGRRTIHGEPGSDRGAIE